MANQPNRINKFLHWVYGNTVVRLLDTSWQQRWNLIAKISIVCLAAYWWKHLPDPGWAVAVLTFGGIAVSLQEHMSARERAVWIALAGILLVVELRAIRKDRTDQNKEFQTIGEGIKNGLGKSDVLIELSKQNLAISASLVTAVELLGRQFPPNKDQKTIITAWGAISQLNTKAVEGATASPQQPSEIQRGKRFVSAEALGISLRSQGPSAATIINDGTNEAGNFAKQLEIGLHMAGWQVGGDNIKMGDPEFFPDSLTVEISSVPASSEDHSVDEAKNLVAALKNQGVAATQRFTTLKFPPNFMRIKVAGQ
jgi:hypothetical protein